MGTFGLERNGRLSTRFMLGLPNACFQLNCVPLIKCVCTLFYVFMQSLLNQSLPPTYFLVVSYAVALFLIGYSLHLAGARIGTLKHFFALTNSCDKQM